MSKESYDPLKIENQLCFPLYACSRNLIRQYKPFLDKLDLTYTQYIAMMILWDRKSAMVKELGSILCLDSGTLTPLLKKLEAKGLVTRRRDERDERNLIVSLTDKGAALRQKALAVPPQISACVGLTHEEADRLYRLLYKMLGRTVVEP